jgi:Cu2+-containing amine oxidase
MPVASVSFALKPVNFFDRNPALDVPPGSQHQPVPAGGGD